MLKTKRKGVGGLLFIVVGLIMSIIFSYTIRFGITSSVSAIINNMAHITCTEVAMYSYQTKSRGYTISGNPTIEKPYGDTGYNVLNEFNNKINIGSGFISSGASHCTIEWDPLYKTATLAMGPVKTIWGDDICPMIQKAIIEDE